MIYTLYRSPTRTRFIPLAQTTATRGPSKTKEKALKKRKEKEETLFSTNNRHYCRAKGSKKGRKNNKKII